MNRALKPDAQAFDEVRILTVPRYKTSGLSGDEWRISASVEFYRKGVKVHETGCRDVETACAMLGYFYYRAIDDGKAFFAGEGDKCDQEGCSEPATVTYRVKEQFSRDNPHEWHKPLEGMLTCFRRFCAKHSRRGDCGFDDSDSNYELVEGTVNEPHPDDIKKSRVLVADMNQIN